MEECEYWRKDCWRKWREGGKGMMGDEEERMCNGGKREERGENLEERGRKEEETWRKDGKGNRDRREIDKRKIMIERKEEMERGRRNRGRRGREGEEGRRGRGGVEEEERKTDTIIPPDR